MEHTELVAIENLTVRYGKELALDIQSPVVIEEGDRVGIIGSNGAGKSTLIKSILGLVSYEGSIRTRLGMEEIATHMQFNEYTDSMPTRYIMEAILQTKISKNEKLRELIAYFEFEDCLRKKYQKLSGGQKQRFTIIMVMMQNAPLTFYDEVTSGLDFETRQKLVEKLVSWYRDRDTGLCIVSHYYEELEQLANKLLILDQGHVVDYGKKEELFRKYCGRAVLILNHSREKEALLAKYERLASPEHLIALACGSEERERELVELLLAHNMDYTRSSTDIEIIYTNAKERYYRKGAQA